MSEMKKSPDRKALLDYESADSDSESTREKLQEKPREITPNTITKPKQGLKVQ